MPLSFTIEIPTSEKKSFINEWRDCTREPSRRAKMIARDALAKARVEQAIDDILDAEFMGTAGAMIPPDPIYLPSEVHSPPLPNPYVYHDTDCKIPDRSSDEQYLPRPKRKKVVSFLNQQQEEEVPSYHSPDVLLMRDDGIQVQRCDDRYEYDCCKALMTHTSPESVLDFEVVDENFADNEQQKQDGRFDASWSTTNTVLEQSCIKLHNNDWGEEQVPQGFTFHKNFPNFGWIQGTVIQIRKDAKDSKTRRVSYSGGYVEDLSIGEIQSAVIDYMEFCAGSAVSGDNTYKHYEKTLKPSSSTYTACAKSKMQEEQQRLTSSTTSSKSRKKQNKAASVPSKIYASLFNERLDMLREFKKIHGHVNVPYTYQNSPLPCWCAKVRRAYREWKVGVKPCYFLNDERVKQLEEIGFIWEIKSPSMNKRFEEKLNELREFRKEHGHVDVTLNRHPEHKSLAIWCKNMRTAYKAWLNGDRCSHAMSDDKIKCLEELGFQWNLKRGKSQVSFATRFQKLLEFKENHGSVEVPIWLHGYESLSLWCSRVRKDYWKWLNNESPLPGPSGLTEAYIPKLKDIGFRFETLRPTKTFEERLEDLREYKRKYGHPNVTCTKVYEKEHKSLASWCTTIRSSYIQWKNNAPNNKGGLNEERVKILEDIGFCFELYKKRKDRDPD